MNDKEIFDLIEKARSNPFSIEVARNIEGGDYWSVSCGNIRAGGYNTMREALNRWAEVYLYLKEKNEK